MVAWFYHGQFRERPEKTYVAQFDFPLFANSPCIRLLSSVASTPFRAAPFPFVSFWLLS